MAEDIQQKKKMTTIVASIQGAKIMFPDSVIAEIVDFSSTSTDSDDVPTWYLGMLGWRNTSIPLVSLEAMNHEGFFGSEHKNLKIVVLHGISRRDTLPYWGFVSMETPRMIHIDQSSLEKQDDAVLNNVEAMHVDIGGDSVVLLDIEKIEQNITGIIT